MQSVDRACQSCQFDCLADSQKGVRDSYNVDLTALAIETRPDPSSKCCEDKVLDEGICGLEESTLTFFA